MTKKTEGKIIFHLMKENKVLVEALMLKTGDIKKVLSYCSPVYQFLNPSPLRIPA